ncbi:hypothetical protein WG622_10225 [Cognatishimia sp. D5M38]|uniref:DUF4136 domain-containing protein n=1 Tax=Cognatishimia coralii TaxID=3083254 RepID=A0ABU8QGR2_9RHOB
MKRWIALAALVGLVAACSQPEETAERLDLGDFVLGHNVVVAPDLQKGPTSRNAEPEELIAAVQGAVAARLGKYDGDRLVHLGINIGGYALGRRGIPLIYTPKSAFVVTVTVWDDRAGEKFTKEPKQLLIFENFGDGAVIGTGYTRSRDQQIATLANNTARKIEAYLAENAICMTDDATEEQLAECWPLDEAN